MHLLLWVDIMLDLICIGFAEQWEIGSKQKIQNDITTGNRTSDLLLSKLAP